MKDFKFKTAFSSVIRPLISEEKDKYLAMASLIDVGNFIPNIDTSKNYDLLPIAFNAFVVNRVNKNGDVIDTPTALAIVENFINKPINIEHNRTNVIGVILNAGFSEFGSDLPLKEEDVKSSNKPFNVTLGGVLWRVVNADVVDELEESTDPTSENFGGFSASWELGFNDFKIVATHTDSKNLEDCQDLVGNLEENAKNLKAFGGSGEMDGKKIYRQPIGEVLPLGIGLTSCPAAEVRGIASKKTELPEKNISQSIESAVNENRRNMKITKVQDITDETLKQVTASAITEFLAEQIKDASKQYEVERDAHKNFTELAKKVQEELQAEVKKNETEVKTLKEKVEAFEKQEEERAKVLQFNSRMEVLENEYNLTEEIRPILASQIKTLDKDEDFVSWKKNMDVFLKPFSKAEAAKNKASDNQDDKTKNSKASAVDDAIDNAEKEKKALANSSGSAKSGLDKWKDALAEGTFEIK